MGHATFTEWQSAIDAGQRYQVTVCWATHRTECPAGVVDTTHYFGSKVRAEQFARAVSRYIGGKTSDGCPISWVLVSALATTSATARCISTTCCYLAYDRGAIQVKRHEINRGYYGAKCTTCASNLEAA